jgi:hypothetical protein
MKTFAKSFTNGQKIEAQGVVLASDSKKRRPQQHQK